MTCTSTGAFDMCGLSYPSWYKDGELVRCHNCTFTRGSKTDVLYAPIEDENAHVYKCLAPDAKRPPPQCQSNNLTVQSLSKLKCTHCLDHMEVLAAACSQCTEGVCMPVYAVLLYNMTFRSTTSPCDTKSFCR